MKASPEQQAGRDDFARLRASLAVARRRHRYYEPVPVVELEALLAEVAEARRRGFGGT